MKIKSRNFLIVFLTTIAFVFLALAITPLMAKATEPEVEITEVSTWSELRNAVNTDKTYIKLTKDIENETPAEEVPTLHRLLFDGGEDYVLDLNGNKLSVENYENIYFTGAFPAIEVSNSSNLEVKNGTIIFTNWQVDHNRTSKGVTFVKDDSTFKATRTTLYNTYCGTTVYATDSASVILDGGDCTALNGFAVYLEGQANLTLDGGVLLGTKVGDSAATVFVDGYGALYSESLGELVINSAIFNTGVQVDISQVDAFSASNHELVLNGVVQTEDVYMSTAGNQFSAIEAGKEYYWYKNGNSCSLYAVQNTLFCNNVEVYSYEKKYAVEVENGTAKVGGVPVTEASYGQQVTIVADQPQAGMEFVRWDTNGVALEGYYDQTTTFTMPTAPVYVVAYYGNESISSVSASVGDIVVGEKAYETEISLDGDLTIQTVEWYEDLVKIEDQKAIFKPGKTYELKILVYPPVDYKFADSITATVNGNNAVVSGFSSYVTLSYTFEKLAENPFPVLYNTQTATLGIGGLIELDTALMSTQNAEFKTAFEGGEVTYQWYKNGEPINGATKPVYNFTVDDVESYFFVTVTVGDKTAYGSSHKCYNSIYQIYLNSTEIVAGGRVPTLTSSTPGVALNTEFITICEVISQGVYSETLDINKTILVPEKTYRLICPLYKTGTADIPFGANVYVNDTLISEKVDALSNLIYDFTVPETDFPVYYKANGEIGIGATVSVDVEKMCKENGTFKNAYDKANPTYQTVFYQWYKDGEPINGATNAQYKIKTTDKDSYINCKVTLVDGKYGIGAQHQITNIVTVINVDIPLPKNGQTRITEDDENIYSSEATVTNMMWITDAGNGSAMQGSDTYVEGDVYALLIYFEPKNTLNFDYTGATVDEQTIAYIYGAKVTNSGSGGGSLWFYIEDVTAIHVHQYSDQVWAYDEEMHWKPCIIPGCPNPHEEYMEMVFHWGTEATCHTKGACAQCGAEYYADHDFSGAYVYVDDMKCAKKCAFEGCTETADWSYHEGGVSDCQTKPICDICHTEYGSFAPHNPKEEWVNDAESHWHECKDCDGQKLEQASHIDENVDGLCDVCGYEVGLPTTPSSDGKGLPTGAIVGIAVGGAVGASVGGFAIFWFVIKKKSFAELLAIFKKK